MSQMDGDHEEYERVWVESNNREERKERPNVEREQQEILISFFSIP